MSSDHRDGITIRISFTSKIQLPSVVVFIETWHEKHDKYLFRGSKHFQRKSKKLMLTTLPLNMFLSAGLFIWRKLDQCNLIGAITEAKSK